MEILLQIILLISGAVSFGDTEFLQAVRLRNTHYYVVLESEYENLPLTENILDMNDNVLARVSQEFKRAMNIEGTGRLLDGRVLNYAGRKGNQTRYLVTPAPFGLGVGTCRLVPFHTVAVDSRVIALGSVIQIRETIGMKLPDGSLHDGLWRAEDVGGAIKRDRIDLFVGDGDQGAVLREANITHLMPLTVEVVSPPLRESCVNPPNPNPTPTPQPE